MGERLTGLRRGLIHPPGVGRPVPGCRAATFPLAVLRGVGSGITRLAHEPAPQLRCRHPHVFAYALRWLRSVRLALKPVTTAPELFKKSWNAIRQLSGDDGYERYMARHAASHPEAHPLSRREWFARQQQHKWAGVKRCC